MDSMNDAIDSLVFHDKKTLMTEASFLTHPEELKMLRNRIALPDELLMRRRLDLTTPFSPLFAISSLDKYRTGSK